ncbi:acetate/propionate family kinase [Pseudomonas sp. S2_H01]
MTDVSHQVLLVLNAGSSNMKFSLYQANPDAGSGPQCYGHGVFELTLAQSTLVFQRTGSQSPDQQQWPRGVASSRQGTLLNLMQWIEQHTDWQVCAAAHRVVHGGLRTEAVCRVDPGLMAEMEALTPLAPLHQGQCLLPISYLIDEHPHMPQFACFDTAFHQTLAPQEYTFGLPRALSEQGLRRYGFHGLSYEYIASVLPDYDKKAARGRTIVAHLGNGASLCAMNNGVSRATTMGFSTLDGVLMGTRPGRLDPGVLLYLMRERGLSVKALEHLLYHECGLFGVSGGIGSDMRVLASSPAPEAKEAIALFVHSVVREIGTMAAALGGVDALVFTAGIGEHAVGVRNAILDGCRWLGLQPKTDDTREGPPRLSCLGSAVSAWVIPTDENLMMARHALRALRETA